jgi:cytochrome c-type biogenesis protein CcmH/NrfF
MIYLSFANLVIWGVAIATLVMLWRLLLSELARRTVERARARHFLSEREYSRARQRERGDG